ncbi:MAG: hypothetical protein HRU15_10155 [Planctomycetes bacterium]|nr:hypothetical protein [Planctomycetota bacterium]
MFICARVDCSANDDPRNTLRVRQNEVIRNNAIDCGFNIIDLHALISAECVKNPQFTVFKYGKMVSEACALILQNEITNLLGLSVE